MTEIVQNKWQNGEFGCCSDIGNCTYSIIQYCHKKFEFNFIHIVKEEHAFALSHWLLFCILLEYRYFNN